MAFSSIIGSALIALASTQSAPVVANTAIAETVNAEYTISTSAVSHGSVKYSVDGQVLSGDIKVEEGKTVTINANASLFYKITKENIKCTADVELVESTATVGEYTFVMPAQNITFTYTFTTDSAVIDQLNKWYEAIKAGNWKEVFSVTNVLTLVSTLFNGGILIAMIKYVIKDKALAAKLEKTVTENMEKLIPEQSKKIILEAFEKVLTPIFNSMLTQTTNIQASQSSIVKVLALAQENTPEARLAILEELSKLQISDSSSIDEIKAYITQQTEALQKQLADALAKLDEIEQSNAEKAENAEVSEEESAEEEKEETPNIPVE